MSRELIVHGPGPLSLVQDAGRSDYQRYGVSVSGALDPEALLIGNLLIGNDEAAAAIEVTFGGAEFEFTHDTVAALTGGDLQPSLDGTPLSLWESFVAPAGSVLRMAGPRNGLRSYLAVEGGIDTEPVLASRSTHVSSALGGIDGTALKAGDRLRLGPAESTDGPGAQFPENLRLERANELQIRVVPGPQDAQFTDSGIETFYSSTYTVTESSDRQGLRLDGPEIGAVDERYDIVSDAVAFGSVQVPGDGKPIILLADRQTTGGYAKIGVVATVDLPLLAQAAPGVAIQFVRISASEAQSLMRERRTAILDADLLGDLKAVRSAMSVNGVEVELEIECRPQQLARSEGTSATATINGLTSTVRIEEIDPEPLV